MPLLVCAATSGELATWGSPAPDTTLLVSGVGIPATFAALATVPCPLPALLVNIGIAGAYPGSGLEIGAIVVGASEVYGDIGFTLPEPPHFQPITQSDFGAFYAEPFPLWVPDGFPAPRGRGCTVNTCTGTEREGQHRASLFNAQFETMEGAAVAQVGRQWGVPVCEIRAISNIASRRAMHPANIGLALRALGHFLEKARPFFTQIGESPGRT